MSRSPATNTSRRPHLPWWRAHGFVLGMIGAVMLAFLAPGPGARGGWLKPDLINNGGIALILFLQGLSLAFEKIKSGAGNWRLHTLIQAYTFIIFPVVGLALNALMPFLWPDAPEAIRSGFLFLCVLPSTISTSVVLTAVARGNTAGALFNAAFSNIIGVIVTPLLVQLLMHHTGQTGSFGPLLMKISLLTLLPFGVGMLLRPRFGIWVDAHKVWISRVSNAVILFIVYAAFCDSVQDRIWELHGAALTTKTFAMASGLFLWISLMVHLSCKFMRLNRNDRIAAYFCSVKKTLAMGVPLAALIFGKRSDLPLILLPVMFYHPVQLFLNGLLANRWARHPENQ